MQSYRTALVLPPQAITGEVAHAAADCADPSNFKHRQLEHGSVSGCVVITTSYYRQFKAINATTPSLILFLFPPI